jgi:hypothetical protein
MTHMNKGRPAGDRRPSKSLGNDSIKPSKSRPPQQAGRYPQGPGDKDPNGPGREAALRYAPQARGRREQVIAGLARLGGRATAEQIGEEIGLHWYLCRPRLSESLALGLVAKTEERGTGALGGTCTVWRITSAEERALFLARKVAEAEHCEGAVN